MWHPLVVPAKARTSHPLFAECSGGSPTGNGTAERSNPPPSCQRRLASRVGDSAHGGESEDEGAASAVLSVRGSARTPSDDAYP